MAPQGRAKRPYIWNETKSLKDVIFWRLDWGVADTCAYTCAIDRSSSACYRSILILTSLANTCTDQSERRSPPEPIRTPEWSSCLSSRRRILFTQPLGTPEHERHCWISFLRLFFLLYFFPPHLSAFGHCAILIWGIETWLGAVPRTNRILTEVKKWPDHNTHATIKTTDLLLVLID